MNETRKVMITRREPMKNIKHWSKNVRSKIYPFVFKCLGTFQLPYACCEEDLFAEWVFETVGHGYYYIFIWRPGYYKKINRLRPYRIATIELERDINQRYKVTFHNLRARSFKWWIKE